MNKQILSLALAITFMGFASQTSAQSNKEKKSRYYQNNSPEPEFNIQGFYQDNDKNEVEEAPVEKEYDVKIQRNERDTKYKHEKRVIEKNNDEVIYTRPKSQEEMDAERTEHKQAKPKGYYTSYGAYVIEGETNNNAYVPREQSNPKPRNTTTAEAKPRKEKEIKMTSKEAEYQTTVVKRRYTNLDVLSDDLDLAKIQRPVFKGICSEAAHDVDAIIVNKNMTSLEKNYHLKQCYILRDKRLRETLDEDQYRKFLRIKDADEYLILTRDLELKDGVNK